jgi:hypothetical protein
VPAASEKSRSQRVSYPERDWDLSCGG